MKIVVRTPNWLGDLVMSLPFVQLLSEKFPHCEIHLLVREEYCEIFELFKTPVPLRIHSFKRNEIKTLKGFWTFCRKVKNELGAIETYYCLPPSFSSALMGKFLGANERIGFGGNARNWFLTKVVGKLRSAHRSEEYIELLDLHLQRKYLSSGSKKIEGRKPYIIINPNSEASSRRLPPSQWKSLLQQFSGERFIFIGTKNDRFRIDDIINQLQGDQKNTYVNRGGETTLGQLISLIGSAQAMISCDSGPAHLAGWMGIPIAVFFGAGNPQNTSPDYSKMPPLVLKMDLDCSPCLKNTCPLKTLACLENMSMDWAAEEIKKYLIRNRKEGIVS